MSADTMQTIEAMARLRTFVLANESQPADFHRCIPARARLESSSTIEGEAVLRQPAQRSACRCNYNKVVGARLHESAAGSPFLSLRAKAPAVQERDSSEQTDDFLVERRLQHASARFQSSGGPSSAFARKLKPRSAFFADYTQGNNTALEYDEFVVLTEPTQNVRRSYRAPQSYNHTTANSK